MEDETKNDDLNLENQDTPKAKGKKKDEEKAKDVVEVDKSTLSKLLERLEILEEAADKGRLDRIKGLRNTDKLVKKVNLGVLDGKIVIGWRMLKNDVWFDQEGKMHEDQVVELYFHNGKKDKENNLIPEAQLNIQSFSRRMKRLPCEVLSESKDRDGNITLLVATKDGEEISVGLDFINIA